MLGRALKLQAPSGDYCHARLSHSTNGSARSPSGIIRTSTRLIIEMERGSNAEKYTDPNAHNLRRMLVVNLTPDLLETLETIAKAATPGPWRTLIGNSSKKRGHVLTAARHDQDWAEGVIAVSHVFHERNAQDWAHIAAASPDVVLTLVDAARERDALREACYLRDRAVLETWSGPASGLEAASKLSAQAEALESLAGIEAPTAEQQRDEAFGKVAELTLGNLRLRSEVARLTGVIEGMREGVTMLESATTSRLRAETDRLRILARDLREFAKDEADALGQQAAGVLERIASDLEGLPGDHR